MQFQITKNRLIQHAEALRSRLTALDVATVGITDGMKNNTLDSESVYQLLDLISLDLRARTDALIEMLA